MDRTHVSDFEEPVPLLIEELAVQGDLELDVIQHPLPSAARCWKLGKALRHAIESYPHPMRVVVLGTGGMSHQLNGKRFTRLIPTREFGLGLAFAVALDATIIRGVLVPALMAVSGRWNWWLPGQRSTPRPPSGS